MKIFNILLGLCAALFLTACVDKDDPEQFIGRWSLEGEREIMQISAFDEETIEVERMYVTALHSVVKDKFYGTIDNGVLKVGEGIGSFSFRFSEEKNRLIGDFGAFRPVPDGWTWRDGYEGLEG